MFSDVSESFSAHCWMGWPDPSLIIGPELLLSGEVAGTEQCQGAELHEVINKWVKIKANKKKRACRLWRHKHPSAFQHISRTCSQLSRGLRILLTAGTGWPPSWMIYDIHHNWPLTSITRSQMFWAHQYYVIFFVLNNYSIQWKIVGEVEKL